MQKKSNNTPTYNLTVLTSETTIFEGEITSAIFPGTTGYFEVLAHHAPLIATVKEGDVEITTPNREKKSIPVPGGFFQFYNNEGTLLH